MGTKVKGLLKGLKHLSITNIFEDKEQEEEIQIGFPTDVKHVAHIGMDDASTTTKPSWMGDYKAAPELAPQNSSGAEGSNLDIVPVDKKVPKESKHGKRRDKDKNKDKDKDPSSHHRARKASRDTNNMDPDDLSGGSKHSRKKKKGSASDVGEGSTKSKKGHHARKSLPDSSLPAFADESTG